MLIEGLSPGGEAIKIRRGDLSSAIGSQGLAVKGIEQTKNRAHRVLLKLTMVKLRKTTISVKYGFFNCNRQSLS
ncbi:hypothetical protein [Martelella soudanensis]|uniref:hypothetical protein n=1 Tax=unclassified Martelella TaxID=2629616 RepID=UPI001FEFA5D0|nr:MULTISPECIES: hypothetical protein [unclassified Martelella]